MRSSQEILRSICRGVELYGANAMGVGGDLGDSGAAKEQEPKSKTLVVGVHGRAGNRYGGGGFYGDPTPDPSVQAIKFVWNAQAQAGGDDATPNMRVSQMRKKKLKVYHQVHGIMDVHQVIV